MLKYAKYQDRYVTFRPGNKEIIFKKMNLANKPTYRKIIRIEKIHRLEHMIYLQYLANDASHVTFFLTNPIFERFYYINIILVQLTPLYFCGRLMMQSVCAVKF